jgi:hypothetical protein
MNKSLGYLAFSLSLVTTTKYEGKFAQGRCEKEPNLQIVGVCPDDLGHFVERCIRQSDASDWPD